jgi:hypothetical protein
MRSYLYILLVPLLAGSSGAGLHGQEAQVGVTVPVTITGGFLDTDRPKADDPSATSLYPGFRVLAKPQMKLGSHWYFYSAIQVRSTPFFYEDAYSADRGIDTQALQLFMGYARSWTHTSVGVKMGKLPSDFGAFPLRYDDMDNALIDEPLPYTYLQLRSFRPGQDPYGLTPVTLYGLPGAEFDLSLHRLDTRLQITNSNPYNPRSILDSGQHIQWTAGAGYTIRQGFRVGVSAYDGPWLNNSLKPLLPAGSTVRDFPASGLGVDAQWAHGPWSTGGEWQHFVFRFPPSSASALNFGYVELKRIISPRWYSAVRGNYQTNNRQAASFLARRQIAEVAVGFRPDRFQLLKVGYEWEAVQGGPPVRDNVFGVQFVTAVDGLSKAFK